MRRSRNVFMTATTTTILRGVGRSQIYIYIYQTVCEKGKHSDVIHNNNNKYCMNNRIRVFWGRPKLYTDACNPGNYRCCELFKSARVKVFEYDVTKVG